MTWQINKKLNAIHILKGEPPSPEWEWQKGRRDWDVATNADFLDGCVTTLTWHRPEGLSQQEQESNARLIAAAPEMLTALEEVLDLFEWSESGSKHEAAYDAARNVIAKARGSK